MNRVLYERGLSLLLLESAYFEKVSISFISPYIKVFKNCNFVKFLPIKDH